MDQNHNPFTGRKSPNHWTVKEVPTLVFKPLTRTYFPGAGRQGWLADLPQWDVQQQHWLPGDRHVPAGHQRRLHPKHRVLWRSWCLQLERWGPWGKGRRAETTTPVRPWSSLPELPHKRAEESTPLPTSATTSTSDILKHFLGTRGTPIILINLKMQVLLYPFYRKLSLGEVK